MKPLDFGAKDPDPTPVYRESPGELLERVKERQRQNLRHENNPMDMERDCDWEHTNFEGHDYD